MVECRFGMPRRLFLAVPFIAPGIASAALNPAAPPDTPIQLTKPKPFPEFQFLDSELHRLSLAHFAGRFVLLDIWATWYVPSENDMIALNRLQAKLDRSRFQIVPVSIDTKGLGPVREFYRRAAIKHLNIYLDPSGSAMEVFNLQDLPVAFLINPERKLIGIKTGGASWNSPKMIDFLTHLMSSPRSGNRDGDQG